MTITFSKGLSRAETSIEDIGKSLNNFVPCRFKIVKRNDAKHEAICIIHIIIYNRSLRIIKQADTCIAETMNFL